MTIQASGSERMGSKPARPPPKRRHLTARSWCRKPVRKLPARGLREPSVAAPPTALGAHRRRAPACAAGAGRTGTRPPTPCAGGGRVGGRAGHARGARGRPQVSSRHSWEGLRPLPTSRARQTPGRRQSRCPGCCRGSAGGCAAASGGQGGWGAGLGGVRGMKAGAPFAWQRAQRQAPHARTWMWMSMRCAGRPSAM